MYHISMHYGVEETRSQDEIKKARSDERVGMVLTRITLFNGTIVASALALVVYCPIWSAWDMSTIPRFRGWMAAMGGYGAVYRDLMVTNWDLGRARVGLGFDAIRERWK